MSRPFTGCARVSVVLPQEALARDEAEARRVRSLRWLAQNAAASAFARELGAPLEFVDEPRGPCFLVGPARLNPALGGDGVTEGRLAFDAERGRLVADGPDFGAVFEALDLLRSLGDTSDSLRSADCADAAEAVARVQREVARTWPGFALHGIDWDAVCAEHAPGVLTAADPLPALQAWLAALGDGHTWVRSAESLGFSPCEAVARGDELLLWDVPPDSAAWAAGARPGFRVLGVDVQGWFRRSAGTPQGRPLIVGRRALAAPVGEERGLEAEGPDGRRVSWVERRAALPWTELVQARELPSGAGYLRIRQWVDRPDVTEAIDAAMERFAGAPGLVVDLRSNTGGNGKLAFAFRDRFLRAGGPIGSLQLSDPARPGRLTPPEPLIAEPAPPERRFAGRVRFLTNGLTYSASEDAMLGLAGLPHVQVFGEPSGGGSGRARHLRLLPGCRLMISTALTFTLAGWCVEGSGIPVDVPIAVQRPGDGDPVLGAADRW